MLIQMIWVEVIAHSLTPIAYKNNITNSVKLNML